MLARTSNISYWFIEITAAFLVLLFVYTGVTKLIDMSFFKSQLGHNPILKGYESMIAWAVPIVELILSAVLIIPRTRNVGLLVGGTLMAMFTGYVAWMLLVESKLPCSCGGIIAQMTWKQHLGFNCLTAIVAFSAWYLHRRQQNST